MDIGDNEVTKGQTGHDFLPVSGSVRNLVRGGSYSGERQGYRRNGRLTIPEFSNDALNRP
jgi:hypothetical protein